MLWVMHFLPSKVSCVAKQIITPTGLGAVAYIGALILEEDLPHGEGFLFQRDTEPAVRQELLPASCSLNLIGLDSRNLLFGHRLFHNLFV